MTNDITELSFYDQKMRDEDEASAKRKANWEALAAAEKRKVNDRMIVILRRESNPLYLDLVKAARRELAEEKQARSARAKAAAAARKPAEPVAATPQEPTRGIEFEPQRTA